MIELTYNAVSFSGEKSLPMLEKSSMMCLTTYPFSHSSVIVSGVFVCVSHVAVSVEHSFFLQEVKRSTASFVPLSQQPLASN